MSQDKKQMVIGILGYVWRQTGALIAVVLIVGAFWFGRSTKTGGGPAPMAGHVAPAPTASVVDEAAEPVIWTCSMHPSVRLKKPGKCPICAMPLIKASKLGANAEMTRLAITEAAASLMNLQTTPVVRRYVETEIRMVGKIDYDETRLSDITARVGGRLDRLFVDYTGVAVQEGDHLVELYSPELLSAQEELIQSLRAVTELRNSKVQIVKETAAATVHATREKLRLLGLTADQIKAIEERGTSSDHVTITAPMGGIVIHKHAQQGMYVQTGTRIYTIADLNQLWVIFEAYESDLSWVRYGQDVEFATEAYPGQTFGGRVAFIDPVLDDKRRTARVRVNVDNADGRLKPGMFVRGTVKASIAQGGRVMNPDIAGKWVSPMHPEIIKDGPGDCDICGMPLVKAEQLGFVTPDQSEAAKPLVVPASAVLLTGSRAIVYVKVVGAAQPTFEGRQVVLGPRAGDYYIVRENLGEGELVVTNGNFKIDSAMQLSAKPSMMNPGDPGVADTSDPHAGHDHDAPVVVPIQISEAMTKQLELIVKGYMGIGAAFAGDDLAQAKGYVPGLSEALEVVDGEEAPKGWATSLESLRKLVGALDEADQIELGRKAFDPVSQELASVVRVFGSGLSSVVYQAKCPMAFNNRGATWLQGSAAIANPYFGASMLKCGEVVGVLSQGGVKKEEAKEEEAKEEEKAVDGQAVFDRYLAVSKALVESDVKKAKAAAMQMKGVIGDGPGGVAGLVKWLDGIGDAGDVEAARRAFEPLSKDVFAWLGAEGNAVKGPVYRVHCPMAFNNKGADWLQADQAVVNPYFGDRMLHCGSVVETLAGAGGEGQKND